jgi:hypothetical protein
LLDWVRQSVQLALMASAAPSAQSTVGWQIAVFFILLLGMAMAQIPAQALFGIGGMSGSGAGSAFWSAGIILVRCVEVVLRLLFVMLPLMFFVRPRDSNRQLIVTNWYGALALAWLAFEIFGLITRLGLAYTQAQIIGACEAKGASVSDCYASMPLVTIGYAMATVASFAILFGLLSMLAKPSRGQNAIVEGAIIGGVTGLANAALTFGLNTALARLMAGDSMVSMGLVFALANFLVNAILLVIAFGYWRRQQSSGAAPVDMAMRF